MLGPDMEQNHKALNNILAVLADSRMNLDKTPETTFSDVPGTL